MRIRKAKINNKEELIKLIQLADERDEQEAKEKVEKYINSKKGFFLTAEENKKIIGYILFKIEDNDENAEKFIETKNFANVSWIAVLPEFRNKHIGSRLLKQAGKYAKKLKKKGVWLGCRDDALVFYEKNGYKNVGEYLRKTKSGKIKPYYIIVKEL